MLRRRRYRSERVSGLLRPWVWSQHWLDVAFLHWQVPHEAVRPCVPAPLDVATYEGRAWLTMVAFRLRVRPRGLPFLPGLSNLVELNVRTYVHCRGQPGIWFLRVYADNAAAMRIARWLTPMPYVHATMDYRRDGETISFHCRRRDANVGWKFTLPAGLQECEAPPGSIDAWLLERYRLYARCRDASLRFAEVAHPPWTVQQLEIKQAEMDLDDRWGLKLSSVPDLAHYSAGVKARFGAFRRCGRVAD
ncbi:MAG: DUF2071 domain-containing protein [Planctomycetes bacterium]|nr:DUF2071 domain-containing protein [Planctomycetota bacterium]